MVATLQKKTSTNVLLVLKISVGRECNLEWQALAEIPWWSRWKTSMTRLCRNFWQHILEILTKRHAQKGAHIWQKRQIIWLYPWNHHKRYAEIAINLLIYLKYVYEVVGSICAKIEKSTPDIKRNLTESQIICSYMKLFLTFLHGWYLVFTHWSICMVFRY